MTRTILTFLLLVSFASAQQTFEDTLKKAIELKNAGDIRGALEELDWASQELNKLNSEKLKSFLPDQVLDYKGSPASDNSAMGLTSLEREYKNAASEIKMSLISGSNSGLGGLAAFAGMAAGMGGKVPGLENIRLKNGKAVLDSTSSTPKLIISPGGSVTINLEGTSGTSKEQLTAFAEALDINAITNYLK